MDFTVNFMERATVVLKEALQLKKYKAMPMALAIVVGIFMLPLVLVSFICAVLVYVSGYLYAVISHPVQGLHNLLREEGQNVKHGTQVVVYFLSWAAVFSAYTMLAMLLIFLTVQYTLFSIFTYLWSLGGFKFHAFAAEEDISTPVEGKYNVLIPVVFVAIMGALLLVVPLVKTVMVFVNNENLEVTFKLLTQLFRAYLHTTDTWRFLVSVVYAAAVFAPFPKKK